MNERIRILLTKWLSKTILRKATPNEKTYFRKLEKLSLKKANIDEHTNFNERYIYITICIIYVHLLGITPETSYSKQKHY